MGKSFQKHYSDFYKEQIGSAVGIYPTNAAGLELGDFGTWNDGLFNKIGNISQFDGMPSIPTEISDRYIENIQAESDKVSTSVMCGGVEVEGEIPVKENPTAASSVQYSTSKTNSFVLTFSYLNKHSIQNPGSFFEKAWDSALKNYPKEFSTYHYRIIYEIFEAEEYALFGSSSKSSSFGIAGDASAVSNYLSGSVGASLQKTEAENSQLSLYAYENPLVAGVNMMAYSTDRPGKLHIPHNGDSPKIGT